MVCCNLARTKSEQRCRRRSATGAISARYITAMCPAPAPAEDGETARDAPPAPPPAHSPERPREMAEL
jgi:hypothetical protein